MLAQIMTDIGLRRRSRAAAATISSDAPISAQVLTLSASDGNIAAGRRAFSGEGSGAGAALGARRSFVLARSSVLGLALDRSPSFDLCFHTGLA